MGLILFWENGGRERNVGGVITLCGVGLRNGVLILRVTARLRRRGG